jgi:hypothetical protein
MVVNQQWSFYRCRYRLYPSDVDRPNRHSQFLAGYEYRLRIICIGVWQENSVVNDEPLECRMFGMTNDEWWKSLRSGDQKNTGLFKK